MASQLYTAFSTGKDWISTAVKTISPYQPYIAASTIIGKTAWQYRTEQKLKKEVSELTVRINRLNTIVKTRISEDTPPLRNKIHELSNLREEKTVSNRNWTVDVLADSLPLF